jgi:hypothetical protein
MIEFGYITGYDAAKATIDIRSLAGNSTFSGVPFDSSLAFYGTPVLPILKTENGELKLKRAGSYVMYTRIDDNNLRIIKLYNDDQAIIANSSGSSLRSDRGTIQDSLLYSLQDGEALVTAPGRLIEVGQNRYERIRGAWLLLKNSGDAYLSNALTTASINVDSYGNLDLRSISYALSGTFSKIFESPTGTLTLGSGPQKSFAAWLDVTPDGVATLNGGNSSIAVYENNIILNTQSLDLTVGGDITLAAPELDLSATTLNVASDTAAVAVRQLSVTGTDISATGAATLALAAGTTASLSRGESALRLTEEGGELSITGTLRIKVGDSVLTISDAGIDISSTKAITFNNGTLYAVVAAAPGPITVSNINGMGVQAVATVRLNP